MTSDPIREVFVIEDSPGDLLLLQTMLEGVFQEDLVVNSAATLAQARLALTSLASRIILLDLTLPDSRGAETYRAIRKIAPRAVIIILTGIDDDQIGIGLMREGAQDYLVKGHFDGAGLRRVIRYAWERSRFESMLNVHRAWWEALVHTIPDAVLISDANDRIVFSNPAAEQLFGTAEDALIGRNLLELHPPEVVVQVEGDLALLKTTLTPVNGIPPRQFPAVALDGRRRPAETLRYSFEVEGETMVVSLVRDISERKLLEQQALQSQKMEAVGQLTAGIAHDFNNMLAVVLANLDILERQVAQEPELVKRVRSATGSARKGALLTRHLLAFSRVQTLEPQSVLPADAVASACELASRTLGPDIRIENEVPATLARVFVDPAELENVLLNLAVNAKDAMPHGGLLLFSGEEIFLTEGDLAVKTGELVAGHYIKVVVTDTGSGMPPAVAARAFEPFFTTKEMGKGTGLGLSRVFGFARQSGGMARLYSELGVGTSVHLLFPALGPERSAEATHQELARHVPPPGASALIVDDEPALLELARIYLEELGYRTDTAGDGPSALAKLQPEAPFSVLFTDVLLPGGLDGSQVAQAVRAKHPTIKVIYTSGFPRRALADKEVKLDSIALPKPYILDDLRRALFEVFGH